MNKKVLAAVIALAFLVPSGAFITANWHCCIEPPCNECSSEVLGCNCELKEKLGMEVCDECAFQEPATANREQEQASR